MLQVAVSHRLARGDGPIHDRLRERGFVALVVPVAAVAVHVDHDIPLVGLAELQRQLDDLGDRLRVLPVHVEDRNLQHLGDIGRIRCGAPLLGRSCEPELVVHDHVDRAAGCVSRQLAEVERLLHHPLAGKGGVAVHQQHHAVLVVVVVVAILPCAHPAERHRVDELQVTGVEGERQVHLLPCGGDPVGVVTQVVLHVAAPDVQLRVAVLELPEDLPGALAQDVRQNVQPAAVRHAYHDPLDTQLRGFLDRQVQQRDQALGSLQGEALRAHVLLVEEVLEDHGIGEPGEDPQLFLGRQLQPILSALHPVLQPLLDGQAINVHELHADGATVGVAEVVQDLPQGKHVVPVDGAHGKRPAQVLVGEAVELVVQLDLLRSRSAQRIELGNEVPPDPIRADQLVHAVLHQGDARHPQLPGAGASVVAAVVEQAGGPERRLPPELRSPGRLGRQRLEVASPVGGHGLRVVQVIRVQAFRKRQA